MPREKPLEELIEEKARSDGSYAIAYALLKAGKANADMLGALASNHHELGVFISRLGDAFPGTADLCTSLDGIATAIEHFDPYEGGRNNPGSTAKRD